MIKLMYRPLTLIDKYVLICECTPDCAWGISSTGVGLVCALYLAPAKHFFRNHHRSQRSKMNINDAMAEHYAILIENQRMMKKLDRRYAAMRNKQNGDFSEFLSLRKPGDNFEIKVDN